MSSFTKGENQTPYIVEKECGLVEANDAFLEFSGFTAYELLNKPFNATWSDLLRINVDPYSIDAHQEAFLFTKSLEARRVIISVIKDANSGETVYFTEEVPNSRFEDKNQYVEKLISEDITGIGVYTAPDFMLIKANQTYLDCLPKPFNLKEFAYGKRLKDFIEGIEGAHRERFWNDIVESNKSLRIKEKEMIKGDTITQWDSTITPISENGEVKYIVSARDNVTERVISRENIKMQTEIIEQQIEELEQKNEQLEAIIKNSSDGIVVVDKKGKFIRMNDTVRKLRKEKTEIASANLCAGETSKLGLKYFDVQGNELTLNEMPSLRVLNGEKIKNEQLVIREGENETYLSISATPVFDKNGEFEFGVIISHDITESIQKDREIKQQKELIESVIHNIEDAIFVYDKDKKLVFKNKAAGNLYNTDKVENINRAHSAILTYDENDNTVTTEKMPTTRAYKGESIVNEYMKTVVGNVAKYLSVNCSSVSDEKGNVNYVISCCRDISNKIERDAIIKHQKEQLEAIIRSMPDGLELVDRNMKITFLNQSAKDIFFNPDAIVNAGDSMLHNKYYYGIDGEEIPREDLPAFRVFKKGGFLNYILTIDRPDKKIYASVNGSPVYDSNGNVNEAILCIRDITEQKKLEMSLIVKQKKQLEAVIENMPDAFAIYNKDGQLIQLNAEARKMHPHLIEKTNVADAHIGFQYFDLEYNPIDKDNLPTKRAFRGEKIKNERIIIKKPDKVQYTEIYATPIFDDANNLDTVAVTHRDITESIKQQQDLNHKQELLLKMEIEKNIILKDRLEKIKTISKLEEISAIKDKLASAVIHDIRAPLSMLISLTGLLEEEIIGNGISDTNIAKDVKKQIVNTYFMVENILDWFSNQINNHYANPSNMKLIDVLTNLIDIIKLMSEGKGIRIEIAVSEDTIVFADKGMLEIILRNLFTNAIKFTNSEGIISINANIDTDKVIIAVSDNGIGIAPDRAKVLLEENNLKSTSGTEGEKGMGLGLRICKDFVQRMGGDIWIDSTLGKGSTFSFSLPIPDEDWNMEPFSIAEAEL